jgi:hypothetical protein
MSTYNITENTQEPNIHNPVVTEQPMIPEPSYGMTFYIVKINNYFKLYKSIYSDQLKKLHELVYSGSQFEIEYCNVQHVKYNILNENILNEYNFIKREFTDETVSDVAKYIKMLSESMAFFRDDTESGSGSKDDSVYESCSSMFRIGMSTKKSHEERQKDKELGYINKSTSEVTDKDGDDSKPTKCIRGIDNDITRLCAYSTDTGIQYNQDVTIHENLANTYELTASHKVLYNRHFYNAVLVDKFKYDLLLHSDNVKSLIPEIEVISELFLKDEAEIKEFSQLIMHEIFYSADDLRKIVNFYLSKNNTECPSISAIRKYINTNFTLDSEITNRIQFKVLFEDICTGMNINQKYHEAIKRSLPLLLTELGLAKKRYSEGIFWYGLKKIYGLLGPVNSNKNLDILTSEIVKLRDEQDTETSKVLSYVFDDKIPKIPVSTRYNKPKNANHQLRSDPIIPDVPQCIERPWCQSTIEPNPYPMPI